MINRVTHQTMYSSFITQMNTNLSAYMDLNYQSSTMKDINKPSDDPSGAAHVLNYRASIATTEQMMSNVDTAVGWLELSGSALQQVDTTLIAFKEAAEQAATGTYNSENREEISSELNQLYEHLIALANSEFNGRFIFAGQNIDTPPYEMGLGIDSSDPAFLNAHIEVTGEIDNSTLVRFETAGELPPAADMTYSYSDDAGETWKTGTLTAGSTVIDLGTAQVDLTNVSPPIAVTAYDPSIPFNDENGTSFVVRPAAIYTGYDDTVPPAVNLYGESGLVDPAINPTTNGLFTENVQVRLDTDIGLPPNPQEVTYSYSTDNGQSWTTQTVDSSTLEGGTDNAFVRLPIPGGFFDIDLEGATTNPPVTAGTQYTVQPQRTNLDYESSMDSYITVNNVGKDIFGGLYTPQGTDVQQSAFGGSASNLFETCARLIGALETNDQEGCAEALEDLDAALEIVLLSQADVGGRLTRLEETGFMLSSSKLDQTERLSTIEDVDVSELAMKLSMQQMAYQTVLQSSSMIMNLNLTNYI